MKAALLTRFGGTDSLEHASICDPIVGSDELLVRVRAVSINRALDSMMCEGHWPVPPKLPHIPGIDPAGDVVAIGAGTKGWEIGDRVAFGSIRCAACDACAAGKDALCAAARMAGVARHGGMAELVALPARAAFRIPASIDYRTASYAVRHGGLALHMLDDVSASDTVLVTGATGALGSAAVQIVKARGGHVIAMVSSPEKANAALALGADAIFDGELKSATIAIETTGDPAIWAAAFGALAMGGKLVTSTGGSAPVPLDLRRLYTRRLRILGAALGNSQDNAAALELAAAGCLAPVCAATYSLEQVAAAFAQAARRATIGKVFIDPSKEAK